MKFTAEKRLKNMGKNFPSGLQIKHYALYRIFS